MTDKWTWFESLYRASYSHLLSVAARRLPRWELAEDAVQEAFLRLWTRADQLIRHPNPGGWLMVTLLHIVAHLLQSDCPGPLPLPEYLPAPGCLEDMVFTLSDALPAGLSSQDREVLLLFYEGQCSYREAAGLLGISISNCGVRLTRARRNCRALWLAGEA